VIASGLVCEKQDILNALNAGAIGISTTNKECWSI
jgi:glycerol uptake operon antiterminator